MLWGGERGPGTSGAGRVSIAGGRVGAGGGGAPRFVEPVPRERLVAIDLQGGKRMRARRTARTEVRISRVELLTPEEHKGQAVAGVAGKGAGVGAACGAGVAGVSAGVQRGGSDGGVGRADRGLARAALGNRGVFPAAENRDADRGPAATGGGRAGEVLGVRRDHDVAGVQPGTACAGRPADVGGGLASAARAGDDRGVCRAPSTATGGRARQTVRNGHLQLWAEGR